MYNIREEVREIGDTATVTIRVSAAMPDTVEIHCDVHKWSKTRYEELLDWWVEFIDEVQNCGYSEIATASPTDFKKLGKFMRMIGMFNNEIVNIDGTPYLVGKMEV